MAMVLLLVAQFLLGMVTNLYVMVPGHHPGTGAGNYFGGAYSSVLWAAGHGGGWLAAHTMLGLALAVLSALLVVDATRSRDARWLSATVAGALFLIGAGFNGASFLIYHQNYNSLIMAALFGLSLCSYVTALYLDRRPAPAHRA